MKRNQYMLVGLCALVVAGCTPDTGTASDAKVDKDKAAQMQAGQGGAKARMGGGLVDEPMAAPPGVKTGMPAGGGGKAGGKSGG